MIRQLRALLVSLFFLSWCSLGFAQSAQVQGQVSDSSGAVIPKATVRVVNQLTGTERKVATNRSGQYSVPDLDPSVYKIFVQASGFSTAASTPITLSVGQNAVLDFKMQVGSEAVSITVDGSGVQINTTDGSVSTVIDRNFVANMPLNGRSFQDLILLTPGTTTNSPQSLGTSGYGGEFSVNGQRTESNVYSVDGVNANTGGYILGVATSGTSGSLPAASALGTTQALISVDALQEFRVESSSYSAEYGLSPGGQFSFATRSGTNDIHGTVFDYLRNNYFDANDWFNDNLDKPITALRQNDFGGTVGGPVWIPKLYDGRNHSFFFASYEGLRLEQPQAATIKYVPSLSLRQNAPSALQAVLNAFPLPTGTALANGLAPFVQSDSLPSALDSTSIRFDQQLTSKTKAFFRFGGTQSNTESRSLSETELTKQANYNYTLGVTTAFSPKVANEFRVNYTRNNGQYTGSLDNFGGAQPLSLTQSQGITTSRSQAAFGLLFPGYTTTLATEQGTQPQHNWNVVDSTTIALGRQTLKIGIDYRKTASRLQPASPDVFSYFNNAQALLANSSYYAGVVVSGPSYPAYTNTAIYVQDEFRASQRLNISLGVRWEVNPSPTADSGTLPYIALGDLNSPSSLTLGATGTRFWKTTYYNFAPRLGIAYRAHTLAGQETVIRAGGGVFFDSGQQSSTQAFGNSPGQSNEIDYPGSSYPFTTAQLNVPLVLPPLPPFYTIYYFPNRLQLPFTLQWNLSLEQALGAHQSFTLSYVGSNGRRLLSQQQLTTPSVNFSYIVDETSGTTSNYNALQAKFQRALSRGLQVLASYTWAHSIDYGSQSIDYAQVRGNSDFDLRQNFNVAATYDFHLTTSNHLLSDVANGWALDARAISRTAFPVILDGNQVQNPAGQYGYSGLNLIPGVPVYLSERSMPGGRVINPAAFALPANGQLGNAPRNFARGFGENEIDMAAQRSFPLVETLKLQFRAEAFNILNHPNFGYIYPYFGGAQFGQATKMLNQSLGNLNSLYQQGGPRSMQFSLKLAF